MCNVPAIEQGAACFCSAVNGGGGLCMPEKDDPILMMGFELLVANAKFTGTILTSSRQ